MGIPRRFAANVAWLFTEHPWRDRFTAARSAGFSRVEFPWPEDPESTQASVGAAGLEVALVNMPAGDLAAGERGWPNDPGRIDEWRDACATSLRFAAAVGCPTINILAGNVVPFVARSDQMAQLEANLAWAVERAAAVGVTVVTEVMNAGENPSYLLTSVRTAMELSESLGSLGWRLQLDTHHLSRSGADIPAAIRSVGPSLGHLQISDAPGRGEPGTGALDWTAIGDALGSIAYAGAIGLEYRPVGGTTQGLGWTEIIGADLLGPISSQGRPGVRPPG